MAKKTSSKDRADIIARVANPLNFCTLGLLIIEGALTTMAVRTTGENQAILIVGMLVALGVFCLMVFTMAIHPHARHVLMGAAEPSPAIAIEAMRLTHNDIRFIFWAEQRHGYVRHGVDAVLGDKPLPVESRLRKLKALGLVETDPHGHGGPELKLNQEGMALGRTVLSFFAALEELKQRGKLNK